MLGSQSKQKAGDTLDSYEQNSLLYDLSIKGTKDMLCVHILILFK
jgi:hypothetical protein